MNRSVTMRDIRQILKLSHSEKLSNRRIAESLRCAHSSVGWILKKALSLGLSWPLPENLTDSDLENMIYPRAPMQTQKAEVDLDYIHKELRRKGVTLMLLWSEYKGRSVNPLEYSQFCERYRQYVKKLAVFMRQVHKAGEKMFVDWAGMTMQVTDRKTGAKTEAHVFVGVLGASSYTYAHACPDMTLAQWIACHVRVFEYFKGVSEIVVPDNLKTGVKTPNYYEPEINRTYMDMASHYGAVIIPARVRKPKDKSKAEVGVQVAERQIMAALRNRVFYSIEEANIAIEQELERLNTRPMQHLKESRKDLYEALDRPALKPLPERRFEFAEYRISRVHMDYHIEVERNFYSVPYQLAGQKVEARYNTSTVEILYRGQRVAIHKRSYGRHEYVTLPQHRPESHNSLFKWPPERIIEWAAKTGPYTGKLVHTIIESKIHPEQAYRQCRGIIRLGEEYGNERVENASRRALEYGAFSYRSLLSILQKGLDRKDVLADDDPDVLLIHENIRGPEYYKNIGGGM